MPGAVRAFIDAGAACVGLVVRHFGTIKIERLVLGLEASLELQYGSYTFFCGSFGVLLIIFNRLLGGVDTQGPKPVDEHRLAPVWDD